MRNVLFIFVLILQVGCDLEKDYIKLECESGLVTPWVELFFYTEFETGRIKYYHDGEWVYDHIPPHDKCIKQYKDQGELRKMGYVF